jgi:hypothetical protein
MFATKIQTEYGLIYYKDPTKWRHREMLKNPDIFTFVRGDKTTSSNSALVTSLKWAIEFQQTTNQRSTHRNPVKFVEICSMVRQRVNPYDNSVIRKDRPVSDINNKHDFGPYTEYMREMLKRWVRFFVLVKSRQEVKMMDLGVMGLDLWIMSILDCFAIVYLRGARIPAWSMSIIRG